MSLRRNSLAVVGALAMAACHVGTLDAVAAIAHQNAVVLQPGQSKKIGRYTVVCTTKAGKRTKTRIVLTVGFQVRVNGTLVKCSAPATPTPKPTPIPPPPPQGARTNPYPMGTAGVAEGSIFTAGGTWTVTVNSVNPDAWPVVLDANEFNSPPPVGSVDFLVNLTVTLNWTQSATITDLTSFLSAVGPSGIGYGISQDCGVLPSPEELDFSDIFPGATLQLELLLAGLPGRRVVA